ncbi:MAG: Gfo/Idh/MocA family oxidoreductase [Candidatus Brockarchaeota archaeon]|nr:Gfo/Idh/MocA family oxidoreductase [Candidatus Brockarchaeota archaeon]
MAVKVGVIGGGRFGTNHLRTFAQLAHSGRVKLVALADVNPKVLEEQRRAFGVKGYENYEEMLSKEEIDAVTIVTPDHLHREIAITSANSGKHILVEKPLDVTVSGCTEMIDAAKRNGVLLQVDFHKRFDPDFIELKRAIISNKLGRIEYGYAWMEDTIEVPSKWFPKWAPNSSPAWFLGIHFYDLVRWLMESMPKRAYATGVKHKLASMGIDAFDSIQAKVEFENGSSFFFDTSWILPESFPAIVNQGLRVVGSEGTWEVDSQNRGVEACTTSEGPKTFNTHFIREGKDKFGRTVFHGYGIDSIVDFVENVEFLQSGAKIGDLTGRYASGEEGRIATSMAVAIHRSIAEGRVTDVELPKS